MTAPSIEGAARGARLLARVRELAFPRFPGTEGEARAADLVAAAFEASGLAVTREPFTASRTALRRLRTLIQLGVAGGIAFLARLLRADATLVWPGALGLLAAAASAGKWRISFERAFDTGPQFHSVNVVAVRPGATARSPHVVLMAHLDSKSQRLPTFWPALAALAALAWLVVAAGASGAAAVTGSGVPVVISALGYAAALGLVLVTWNPDGNASPGAMDNATGLAVLEELARTLPGDPALRGTQLTFLATGAEEAGLVGAMRWINAHDPGLDVSGTCFVNVDSVGVGKGLLVLDANGEDARGRRIADRVRAAARATGVRVGELRFLPGVGVDTMPIAARGYATVSLVGEVLGAASRRFHSAADTPDMLDPDGLEAAVVLVTELVRDLGAAAE